MALKTWCSGPGWIDSDRYDVVATIPEGTPAERSGDAAESADRALSDESPAGAEDLRRICAGRWEGRSQTYTCRASGCFQQQDRTAPRNNPFKPPATTHIRYLDARASSSLSDQFGRLSSGFDSRWKVRRVSLPTARWTTGRIGKYWSARFRPYADSKQSAAGSHRSRPGQ